MARPLRIQFPNAAYHVTCRGIRKEPIFYADGDRREFLAKLNETTLRFGFALFAYCLMPNHYHLFLQTPRANLSQGLHDLNAAYANWLKSKYSLVGHVFQGRFKSILVETDTYAVSLSIYIHLNPCRWGLAARPEDYPWSSCRDYLGLRETSTPALDTARVLQFFGGEGAPARDGYERFMWEKREMEDPLKAAYRRIALGSPAFVDRVRRMINDRSAFGSMRENSAWTIKACRSVTPDQVFAIMAAVTGCSREDILKKKRGLPWRAMGMFLVKKHCDVGLREAGRIWDVDYSSVSINAKKFRLSRGEDRRWAEQERAIESRIAELRSGSASGPGTGTGTERGTEIGRETGKPRARDNSKNKT